MSYSTIYKVETEVNGVIVLGRRTKVQNPVNRYSNNECETAGL